MIAALALLGFAALVVLVAGRSLPGAQWTRRAPRLGVVAWQAASLAVPVSVMLAGLALALPVLHVATDDLAGMIGACEFLLREHYETPGGVVVHVLGVVGAAAVSGRLAYSLFGELRAVRAERRRQQQQIRLVGRADLVPGAWVVDDPRPAVFCVPGHHAKVVLTTGALGVLTAHEQSLALAHERAHLRGRHDVALAFASALRRAMPRIRLFVLAEQETATLVEMLADDHATPTGHRRELATALVKLAEGPRPAGALAANGGAAVQRVRRLLGAATPGLPAAQRWLVYIGAAAVIAMPLALAAAPALETALLDYCAVALHA